MGLVKNRIISFSEIKKRPVIGPYHSSFNRMLIWPLVKIDLKFKYLRFHQRRDWHAHLHDLMKILCEQEAWVKVVLISDNILHNEFHSFKLIHKYAQIKGVSIEVLLRTYPFKLVFVKQRILRSKVLFKIVAKQILVGISFKREKLHEVSAVKLKKTFEKDGWLGLISYNVDDVNLVSAHVHGLEH